MCDCEYYDDEETGRMNAEADADYQDGLIAEAEERGGRQAARLLINQIADYLMEQTDVERVKTLRDLLLWLAGRVE